MKICPKCNAQLDDNATFCTNCGVQFVAPNQQPPVQNPMPGQQPPVQGAPYQYAPPVPVFDHTAEFDPADISDNKVFAMIPYLFGVIGIIIALLATHESKYTMFHVRQAVKLTVVNTLVLIISLLLVWTIIVPIAGAVCAIIIFVLQIVCFFQVCSGKAVEPAIIRSFKFLK